MSHGKCHLCDATCAQCTGPEREDCTSCPTTRYYDEGTCVIRCQKGRYVVGRQCHFCHHTCHECTDEGPDNCTSCDKDKFEVDRYLYQSQCREICPARFFHSVRKRCEPCPTECIICSAADHCIHCNPGHQVKNGQCVPLECSQGEVADAEDDNCIPCDTGCKQCERKDSGDQETVCLKCDDGFYQLDSDCYQSCPDRTYSVKDTMVCAPCEDKKCANCDSYQCYWCEEGFYVFDGECVDHCKKGFFVDEEDQECEPCHRSCRTCGGPRFDDCDSCEDGFTLKNGECLEGRQLDPCREKHFRNAQGECEQCHSLCKTCSGAGRENCSSCYSGRFLTPKQTCMIRCPPGRFANKASSRCEECSEGCVTCQDDKHCQRCRSGLYLHNEMCVVDCPRGFPQDGVCQLCEPQCESCRGNSSHCLSCGKQYFLLDHSCTPHCPEGYHTSETECHRCPAHCRECNEDGLCRKCAHYYFLHEDKCVDDCPDGFFASEEQEECMRCHADCASCDGPDIDDCDVCRNPKAVRYNGECLADCPKDTYYDEGTNECRDCDRTCLSCSGPEPSSCLSCGTNRQRDASGHCVWYSRCSLSSYIDDNGECQKCHKLCHRCYGPGKDQCFSCDEPPFLLNSTCVQQCPVGFYADNKNERVCERCHSSCQSCVGRHSVECVICKPGFFKQGSSCLETCSESHFGNTSSMQCEHCDPSCGQCWGPGNRNCLSCRDGYVYLRNLGQCLTSCPPGYYQSRFSKTCHRCHPTCKTCSGGGAVACLSCYDGFTDMRGICESKCLVGFYAASKGDDPNCKPCDPSCLDCRGPTMRNCTVCPALKILSDDSRCLSCCGNDTRHDGKPLSWECCDCKASRDECIMSVNFLMRETWDIQHRTSKLFITACVLLVLAIGGGVFLFLNARSNSRAILPKTKPGGYEQLDTNGGIGARPTTSSFGEYSDRITECEGEEDEDDDDEDIVYMGQDGTVYRKFKYGLLDEDEIELEYDDETYSYK
ncbi:proprotein convertase subtilisin/kexin type 5-like [Cheilinus undulatus]|uniref:proprotein convertase subtilisin/kexin type 5-like n=1 Tax=Cheilinus undulatus TaxID=241271 RepID=UPI001BD2AA37|nr:proprotein convertase subtilisin/kexin type 5-like [Cheilinus undulatus]